MKRFILLVGAASLAAIGMTSASAGGTTAITVPSAGPKTVSTTFSGTFPVGANVSLWASNSGSCKGDTPSNFVESHPISVSVPAGAYGVVKAKMSVIVDPSTSVGGGGGNFMELLDPTGSSYAADGQKKELEIDVTNPQPGTWTLLTCQFLPSDLGSDNYTGTVTIKTKCKAASPCTAAKPKGKK